MIELQVEQQVARLTLASPPVNALSPDLLSQIESALDSLEHRDDWNILVLASSEEVFSAGGDLQVMSRWMQSDSPGAAVAHYARRVQQLCRRIESLPQLTIAECMRSALGGGLELALACDVRMASASAKFGLPEVKLGLLPGAGGTQRLTRLCGKATAMKLILGAEVVSAEQAFALGIVQWMFPVETFMDQSMAVASRIAKLPMHALRESKACINSAATNDDAGFDRELRGLTTLANSSITRDLVAHFLNGKRETRKGLA